MFHEEILLRRALMNIDIYMTLESCYETLLQKITDACILFRDLRWSWSAFLPLFVEALRVSAIEKKKTIHFWKTVKQLNEYHQVPMIGSC